MLLNTTHTFLNLKDWHIASLTARGLTGAELEKALFYLSLQEMKPSGIYISGMNMCDYEFMYEEVTEPRKRSLLPGSTKTFYKCAMQVTTPEGEITVSTFESTSFALAKQIFMNLVEEHAVDYTILIQQNILKMCAQEPTQQKLETF